MKMPGQRAGFQISDILGLNEGKPMEPAGGAGPMGPCSLELPPYPQPPYPPELLRHHQPWLIEHHEGVGKCLPITNFSFWFCCSQLSKQLGMEFAPLRELSLSQHINKLCTQSLEPDNSGWR